MKRILANLLLIFFGIILSLIFLEIVARIIVPKIPKITSFRFSPIFEYEHVPNYSYISEREEFKAQVTYNSDGLRDREFNQNKDNNVFRIAVVGDSYVEGAEVELNDTFVKQLEKFLNDSYSKGIKYEVINFGTVSYNSDHEYVVIKEKVSKYNPDLVILVFFFNDLDAFNKSSLLTVQGEKILPLYPLKPPTPPKVSWARKIITELISRSVLWDYLINRKLYGQAPELLLKFHNFKTAIFGEAETDRSIRDRLKLQITRKKFSDFSVKVFQPSKQKELEQAWQAQEVILKEEKKTIESWGSKFMVVLATAPFYYREQSIDDFIKTYGLTKEDFDPQLSNKKILELLNKLKIDHLDLLPMISEYEKKQEIPLHYQTDIHWTKEGHRVVAEIIFDYLRQNKLLKPKD